jgi:hypothetical protein
MTPSARLRSPEREAFYERIGARSMAPLWESLHQLYAKVGRNRAYVNAPAADKVRFYTYRDATTYGSQLWTAVSFTAKLRAAPRLVRFSIASWRPATKESNLRPWRILSCASGVLFESILRPNDPQNGFHTAWIGTGRSAVPDRPV